MYVEAHPKQPEFYCTDLEYCTVLYIYEYKYYALILATVICNLGVRVVRTLEWIFKEIVTEVKIWGALWIAK